ncbi:MAG: 4-(cytidine 5'-diphospho)-2-C-methyl-D-erythritol kinase [Clostridia bacterium]|nr:4-(cytidine 5'-diphospho)-2-C-methyl-D-erythritol kinase [Clostridia bacterium]
MERKTVISAYAKINTYLEVVGKREDGYHELHSHMQLITLSDTLTITTDDTQPFSLLLRCDRPEVPTGEDNLILRAARALFARYPMRRLPRIEIDLEKKIPMQGGLAGGSTDAAATLIALRDLLYPAVTEEALCTIAATIGADVPFCIRGRRGAQSARGIGEILERAPELDARLTLVLVSPGTAVSTPAAFRALDAQADVCRMQDAEARFSAMLEAVGSGELSRIERASFNCFEEVIFSMQPRVGQVFAQMRARGADMTRMSGSGPTIVGYFENAEAARRCADAFCESGFDAYLASPLCAAADH